MCGILGKKQGGAVQVGMGDIVKDNFVIVEGRKAWTMPGRDFTRVEVSTSDDIAWRDSDSDSTVRTGTMIVKTTLILLDEVEEWMTTHGFEYDLIPDDAGNAKAVLAMFDLDAFLLFKLTWAGV